MIVPLLLGYVVGAVGIYALLTKTAAVVEVDDTPYQMPNRGEGEVIDLFGDQEIRKAA
jgi:hypothetical protein